LSLGPEPTVFDSPGTQSWGFGGHVLGQFLVLLFYPADHPEVPYGSLEGCEEVMAKSKSGWILVFLPFPTLKKRKSENGRVIKKVLRGVQVQDKHGRGMI